MSTSFMVTWDYRCPFARNAHEHIVLGIQDGADWDVQFMPFSLGQAHEPVEHRWQSIEKDSGLLALQAAVAVRDAWPEHFLNLHLALFDARHDRGVHIRERAVIENVLREQGLDPDAVLAEVETGRPLEAVRREHEAGVATHNVWGVPTFITEDKAVFVRLMHRPESDAKLARRTIERVLDLMTWSELNEFKHTALPK